MLVLIIAASLIGLIWLLQPMGNHEGSLGKLVYPKRLLPPNIQQVQTEKNQGGAERITTFTTTQLPEDVLTFYAKTLPGQGWYLDKIYSNGIISYDYINGAGNPAFSLEIQILSFKDDQTAVKLRQVLSGPFSATNWPDE